MPRLIAVAISAITLALCGTAHAQPTNPSIGQRSVLELYATECGAGTTLRVEGNRRTCVSAPTAAGSRVWVVGTFEGGRIFRVYAINASDGPARVGMTAFDHTGTMLVDLGTSTSVSGGGIGFWSTPHGSSPPAFWVLVTSDRPIFVDGEELEVLRDNPVLRQLSAHPLDCDNPEGYEFACRIAAARR